jgi:hypothetical protein
MRRASFFACVLAGLVFAGDARSARAAKKNVQAPPARIDKLVCVFELEDSRSGAEEIERLLRDFDRGVRRRAALAAGWLVDPALPRLQGLLNDQEVEVWRMAAFALGPAGDRAAVDRPTQLWRTRTPRCAARPRLSAALGIGAGGGAVGRGCASEDYQLHDRARRRFWQLRRELDGRAWLARRARRSACCSLYSTASGFASVGGRRRGSRCASRSRSCGRCSSPRPRPTTFSLAFSPFAAWGR